MIFLSQPKQYAWCIFYQTKVAGVFTQKACPVRKPVSLISLVKLPVLLHGYLHPRLTENRTKSELYNAANQNSNLRFSHPQPGFWLRRAFMWRFIVADVDNPIIGLDLLHHFDLLISRRSFINILILYRTQMHVVLIADFFNQIHNVCFFSLCFFLKIGEHY